jgi:hypothetical protein
MSNEVMIGMRAAERVVEVAHGGENLPELGSGNDDHGGWVLATTFWVPYTQIYITCNQFLGYVLYIWYNIEIMHMLKVRF